MYSVNVILLKMVKVELIMSFSPVILCPSYIFCKFSQGLERIIICASTAEFNEKYFKITTLVCNFCSNQFRINAVFLFLAIIVFFL